MTMNLLSQCVLTAFILLFPIYLIISGKISQLTFKILCAIVLTFTVALPVLFKCSLSLQRGVLYLNFLDRVSADDLKHLQLFNISNGRNFYTSNGNITLGVWHLLPSFIDSQDYSDKDFENSLSRGYPILIYLHGNIGTRATDHRLQLYKLLNNLNYHVITFDYRSYGDSTNSEPHEKALVSDGFAVSTWVFQRAKNSPVFLWGHSLGTGLTTNVVAKLTNAGFSPKGVILEAPFDNMPSEIRVHPFGTFFRYLPWYDWFFSRPYYTNDEDFNSAKYILEYSAPTLILHAQDDHIIPSDLGQKLLRVGKKFRKPKYGPVEMRLFSESHKYGHKFICRAPELPLILKGFVERYKAAEFPYSSAK